MSAWGEKHMRSPHSSTGVPRPQPMSDSSKLPQAMSRPRFAATRRITADHAVLAAGAHCRRRDVALMWGLQVKRGLLPAQAAHLAAPDPAVLIRSRRAEVYMAADSSATVLGTN